MPGINFLMGSGFLTVFLWIFDAAVYAFYQDSITFGASFFTGVPLSRLLIRIGLSVVIIAIGFYKFFSLYWEEHHQPDWDKMKKKDYCVGSGESGIRSQRLVYHCLKIAAFLKLTADQQLSIRTLCYCYDIGKVAVPRHILEKQDLTAAEYQQLDQHVIIGAKILSAMPELAAAAPLVLHHHENWNGSGVLGIKGTKIPLGARIFHVVWAYDTMLYPVKIGEKARVCNDALEILRYYSGTLLDPEVVEIFIKLMKQQQLFTYAVEKSLIFND